MRIYIDSHHDDEPQDLDPDAVITYEFEGRTIAVFFRERGDEVWLEIMGTGAPSPINVQPQSGNVIFVR